MTTRRISSPWLDERSTESGLPPEVDSEGNVEYKLKLMDPSVERFQHLVTQLKWRLAEGGGEAMYEIGVSDNGSFVGLSPMEMKTSIETLRKMAGLLNADVSIIRQVTVRKASMCDHAIAKERDEGMAEENTVVEALIRRRVAEDHSFMDIRIAIVGGHDVGKSTLLGYLTNGTKDNGRGRARLNLLRHRHEIESGRTSSIAHEILGFDSEGQLISYATTNISTWEQICESSSKIMTLLDTCGYSKYLKTTISGLSGYAPDYACLVVSATSGEMTDMTREHLSIAVMLNVPVFVVVTKIDLAAPVTIKQTLESLWSLLQAPPSRKTPVLIRNEDDVVTTIASLNDRHRQIPVFLLSSVTGANIPLLSKMLNLLPKPMRNYESLLEETVEFQIEEVYNVPDVGVVVGGILRAGRINILTPKSQRTFWIGPNTNGRFARCTVTSIHRHRMSTTFIHCGQSATLALTFADEVDDEFGRLQRSMVILGTRAPVCCIQFEADLFVLHHPTTLQEGSHGMVHSGSVRQMVRVRKIFQSDDAVPTLAQDTPALTSSTSTRPLFSTKDRRISLQGTHASGDEATNNELSAKMERTLSMPNPSERTHVSTGLFTGERSRVLLEFLYEPKYLRLDSEVLFLLGSVKCIGKIRSLTPYEADHDSTLR